MSAFKEPEDMSPSERWIIAITVMLGAFISVMDTSVVNVALSHMMGSFGTNLSSITWVATSYSIAEIIMVTMSGWWSAVIGRRNFYIVSFVLFTVGSILCGTATSFAQIIIYRIIQGIGGGALIPVSQAILRETFPPAQQGIAMAIYGMGVVLAPALGPVCGGWLTDMWGWPWIFYVNIPVCIIGIFMIVKFVHDPPYLRRGVKSVDWLGIGLLTAFLTGMQIVLERGQEDQWFESDFITTLSIITVVSLVIMVFWELRSKEPIINFRVLKDLNLTLGSIIGLIFGIALFGTTFVLPQFTQELLGYSAFDAGIALAPRAITLLLLMPVAGVLYQKIGPRILMLLGVFFIIWSYYDLMQLNTQAGMADMIMPLLIMGVGMPFIFIPQSAVALCTVAKSDMTSASSLFTLARRIGGNLGYAVVAVLLDRGTRVHLSYLSENVSELRPFSHDYLLQIGQKLHELGVSSVASSKIALGMLEQTLVQQAKMLAYNEISFIFGCLFLLLIPLIFLCPSKAKILALNKVPDKKTS
ncbi:DHA2 family efflux MFS transporter permease subunit [Desulfovibrio sp. UCD-KL4C]|uniref:DHA2 family efflux MFS transporter permease subunit n=1 Tax=Desulfovibrio sp. UCD-KL4C TaxID=2578120 RepID=UPI0025BB0D9D|nr:DHA2 family efflux MFS transporter permease subunit [Desulfovibrio sp. UCD-KL4C]